MKTTTVMDDRNCKDEDTGTVDHNSDHEGSNTSMTKSDLAPVRESWSHRADGIITLIAYSIGEGTLLKFPYLCARNGGGAFLIPFLIFTAVCALPLYYLEMVIGQYYQRGPVEVWKLCPAMKGLGLGSAIVALVFAIYTPMYFSWYLYYLVHSFSPVIPWSNCDNDWNTKYCITAAHNDTTNNSDVFNVSAAINHTSVNPHVVSPDSMTAAYNTSLEAPNNNTYVVAGAAEEFWRLNVLEITGGLDDLGGMRWPLFGCLTVTFLSMYLILFKGIRVSGKIVYLTFFCPIILITILFVRAVMLPGATDGLIYYIKPNFAKLKNPKIWIEACGFALHSMGTNTGITITMASHNKFNSNCFRDSVLLVFGDAFITIYCGFAMFTVLGHLAWAKGVTLDHFQSGGFNIAFMVFPEAVTYLPLPQLWSVILFLMLITLGLDSTIPAFEVAMSVVGDRFPWLTRRRWLMVSMVMLPMFLLSVPYATQGGIYLLILVDWFCSVPPVMLFGVVQSLVLAWVFGVKRLDKCTGEMYGKPVPKVIKFLVKFLTPILLMVIFAYALYEYRPPKYGDYYYPQWAAGLGWMLSVCVMLPLPLWMVYSIWNTEGDTFKQKVMQAFRPVDSSHYNSNENMDNTNPATESFL